MTDTVLIGQVDTISRIPQADWEQDLRSAPEGISQRLAFMSNEPRYSSGDGCLASLSSTAPQALAAPLATS